MKLPIKYTIIYITVIVIVVSRLKVEGMLNNTGLFFLHNDPSQGMERNGYNWQGFEGSIIHFFALGALFIWIIFDFLYHKVTEKFFLINCLIVSFAWFAFEETLIRLMAIALFCISISKAFQLKRDVQA